MTKSPIVMVSSATPLAAKYIRAVTPKPIINACPELSNAKDKRLSTLACSQALKLTLYCLVSKASLLKYFTVSKFNKLSTARVLDLLSKRLASFTKRVRHSVVLILNTT